MRRSKADSPDEDLEAQQLICEPDADEKPSCCSSPRECQCRLRSWADVLAAITCAALLLVAAIGSRVVWEVRHGTNSLLSRRFGKAAASTMTWLDPYYHGRLESREPMPRCCQGAGCLPPAGRPACNAFVTMLRTDQYLGLTQALACSLNKTNPGLPLVVLTVAGDLQVKTLEAVSRVAQVQFVPEFTFRNNILQRFALNWVMLRGWELTEWDGILMLDSDMMVDADLSWIFDLPTDFATVLDTDRVLAWPKYSAMGQLQGGLLFFRPCAAVAAHMQALASGDPMLQYIYHSAEQTFLDWYFKYSRMTLPQEYNSLVGTVHLATRDQEGRNVTCGGAEPVIRHIVGNVKPWEQNLEACRRTDGERTDA